MSDVAAAADPTTRPRTPARRMVTVIALVVVAQVLVIVAGAMLFSTLGIASAGAGCGGG